MATLAVNGSHEDQTTAIVVQRLRQAEIVVPVVGITPLIVHRFDEKARKIMLDDMQGKKKAGRDVRNPEDDYRRSRYIIDDERDGFPAVGFKAAMVNAATHYEKLTKVMLKQSLFIHGEGADQLVPIIGEPVMREDFVRYGQSGTDLRYRAMYWPWEAELRINFITSGLTAETVVALVDAGGYGGIGEWRPSAPKSATGTYGRFAVKEG